MEKPKKEIVIPDAETRKLLKEQRRLAQEAQKAAKLAKTQEKPVEAPKKATKPPVKTEKPPSKPIPKQPEKPEKANHPILEKSVTLTAKRSPIHHTLAAKPVSLFAHLPQYERESTMLIDLKAQGIIHPTVLQLGLLYQEQVITGGNARAIGLLGALKTVIQEYSTPPGTSLARHLYTLVGKQADFLSNTRPLCASMRSALRYIKQEIGVVDPQTSDKEAIKLLSDKIDKYIKERIYDADEAIAKHVSSLVVDGDVIVTYGTSSGVLFGLLAAKTQGREFEVVVVGGRPRSPGTVMLKRLVQAGIPCTYVMVNGLSYALRNVTKCILGASAMFSNGAVMSRVGTSMVAMMAHEKSIPVFILCETYKFSENVKLDSFTWNEVGDPDELVHTSLKGILSGAPPLVPPPDSEHDGDAEVILADWRDIKELRLLNLVYDVTPARLTDHVITELGIYSVEDVPFMLREVLNMAGAGAD